MLTLRYTGRLIRKKHWVVAYCPELDLYSQGDSEEEAKRNLEEAVHIFLDETSRMGTLAQVLTESGYQVICRKRRVRRTPTTFEGEARVCSIETKMTE